MLMAAMMFANMSFLLAGFIRCSSMYKLHSAYQRRMWRRAGLSDNIEAIEAPSQIQHVNVGKVALNPSRLVNVVTSLYISHFLFPFARYLYAREDIGPHGWFLDVP